MIESDFFFFVRWFPNKQIPLTRLSAAVVSSGQGAARSSCRLCAPQPLLLHVPFPRWCFPSSLTALMLFTVLNYTCLPLLKCASNMLCQSSTAKILSMKCPPQTRVVWYNVQHIPDPRLPLGQRFLLRKSFSHGHLETLCLTASPFPAGIRWRKVCTGCGGRGNSVTLRQGYFKLGNGSLVFLQLYLRICTSSYLHASLNYKIRN